MRSWINPASPIPPLETMGNSLQIPAATTPGEALRHRNRAAQQYLLQLTTATSEVIVFLSAPNTNHRWNDFEDLVQDTCPAISWDMLSQQPSLACKPFRDTAPIWIFEGFPLLEHGHQLQEREQLLAAAIERASASGARSAGVALPSAGPARDDRAISQDIEAWHASTMTIRQHVHQCPEQIHYYHPAHSWTIRNEGN